MVIEALPLFFQHFKAVSYRETNESLESKITLSVEQQKVRSYLTRGQLQLCATSVDFQKHLELSYSLLPRLNTECSSGKMQLALTEESLRNCLQNRPKDYCFSFVQGVKPSTPSSMLLMASPDYEINKDVYTPSPYGLVFPYWPSAEVTVNLQQPVFRTRR